MMAPPVPWGKDPVAPLRPLDGRGRWLRFLPFLALGAVGVAMAWATPQARQAPILLAAGLVVAITVAVAALPWHRLPAATHVLPVAALIPVASLLEYAAGGRPDLIYLTALPVIWAALFHTRAVLITILVLVGLAILGTPLLLPPAYPAPAWGALIMAFVLSCFGGLAGQYLVSRTRTAVAEAHGATSHARADRDLLNAYLDTAACLVVVVDNTGRVTLFNRYAEQVTGYRAEEIVGRSAWHLGREPEGAIQALRQVVAGGGPTAYEGDWIAKDGIAHRISWTVNGLTDESGMISHVIGVGIDVTEQRANERLLENVLASAVELAIIAADQNGIVRLFNIGAERLLGYTSDEVVNEKHVEFMHLPEELAAIAAEVGVENFRDLLTTAPPKDFVITREWTLVRKDGSHFLGSMSVATLRDGEDVVGYVNVARDITAERAATDATRQALDRERAAAERLREIDQVKNDFVATVSHDLRTPLTSIIGNTELLLEGDAGDLGPMQTRLLEAVDRNARRLDTLVGDLLLLSRIESGTLRMNPRPVAVRELVTGAMEALTARRSGDVETVVSIPDQPVLVEGDPDQLERVVTNLIGNALKFTPPGGRVEVGARVEADQVRLWVSDTGIGIPPDELSHIFDRFYRSSRSQKKDRPGTGLGLTIAKSIVEQHHGTIEASANPSGGTIFAISLPRLTAPADTAETLERA